MVSRLHTERKISRIDGGKTRRASTILAFSFSDSLRGEGFQEVKKREKNKRQDEQQHDMNGQSEQKREFETHSKKSPGARPGPVPSS